MKAHSGWVILQRLCNTGGETLVKRVVTYLVLLLIASGILIINTLVEKSKHHYIRESITPPQLARITVEKYIKDKKMVILKGKLAGTQVKKAGVFVSIYKNTGNRKQLRGCIGTFLPTKYSVKSEIVHNAISAATSDPRFEEIQASELDSLLYSVDILDLPEKVESPEELNPEKYGVIVSDESGKRAVLLPDLPGIDSVEKQIAVTRKKAGISPDEKIEIKKFKVKRFSE